MVTTHVQADAIAHALVRSLPPETVSELAALDQQELERVFRRALGRAIAGRMAAGLIADSVRNELVPLIEDVVRCGRAIAMQT